MTRSEYARSALHKSALDWAEAAGTFGSGVLKESGRCEDARTKPDGRPVTVADRRAEAIICDHLAGAVPPIPMVAEESTSAGKPISVAERFLLIDPLDGTREFIAGNGEFTINIALIERGRPSAGAVYAPAIGRLWLGGHQAFVCAAAVGANPPQLVARGRIHSHLAAGG